MEDTPGRFWVRGGQQMNPMGDLKWQQRPGKVVDLNGWELDDEFPIGLIGAKPKRIFTRPTPAPHRFLIGGHHYLFKESEGR